MRLHTIVWQSSAYAGTVTRLTHAAAVVWVMHSPMDAAWPPAHGLGLRPQVLAGRCLAALLPAGKPRHNRGRPTAHQHASLLCTSNMCAARFGVGPDAGAHLPAGHWWCPVCQPRCSLLRWGQKSLHWGRLPWSTSDHSNSVVCR